LFSGRALRDGLQLGSVPNHNPNDMKTALGGLFVCQGFWFAKALPIVAKVLLKQGLCLKKSFV
jgi:hypothetical protein